MAEAGVADAPRRRSVQCASPKGLHRVSYLEWGDPRNRDVVVCVHGLTRNGRDFDDLARALASRWRVICPDVVGRGDSDRLADPMLYALPQYVADMVTLVARLDVEAVSWVGTSMGGLIGMALAAQPGTPIRRLVLNDAGPVIGRASLERIGVYVGLVPAFPSVELAEAYVRTVCAPFGPHSDAQWRQITEAWMKNGQDGWQANYDPRIADVFRATMPDKDLEIWPVYDAVRCPTLVLRGALSDLLSRQTTLEMTRRGPKAGVVEIKGVGHAPTLMHPEQIAPLRDFLMEGDSA
jgi:pimeloyl-ACP methyl ester carboxylesterase